MDATTKNLTHGDPAADPALAEPALAPQVPEPTDELQPADLTPTTVPWFAVTVFAVLACGLAWLVQIPVWTSPDKMQSHWFMLTTVLMMYTPAVAALVVLVGIVRPSHKARYLGLVPFGPKRTLLLFPVTLIAALAMTFAAFGLALALGWAKADWSMALWAQTIPAGMQITPQRWAVMALLFLPLTVVQASIAAFGEELGWRGFLATALAPLGFWRSALITGVLWGLWHAPIILLGYNFQRPNAVGLAMMVGFCLVGAVLQTWCRYYSRTVWLPTWTHGCINAVAVLGMMFTVAGADPVTSTVLGYPGWIVAAVVIAGLAAVGFTGRRLPTPLVPAPLPTAPSAPTVATVNADELEGTRGV